eukprot:g3394.t1
MAALGSKVVLAAVAMSAVGLDVVHGISSSDVCFDLKQNCVLNAECATCANRLEQDGLIIGDIEFDQCDELYTGVCEKAELLDCDVNEILEELLACTFEDEAGCDDFTTCADATAGSATEAPAAAPSAAPTTADGFSLTDNCADHKIGCLVDLECLDCATLLEDSGLTLGDIEFDECDELYTRTCEAVELLGCNVDNERLEELLACTFELEADCDDFTTCVDATAAGPAKHAGGGRGHGRHHHGRHHHAPSTSPATPSPSTT